MLADTLMEHVGKWRLCPVLRRTLLVFSEALICLSYTAVVPPRGIAPRSSAYRAEALLLSYGGKGKWLPDVDSHHDVPFNRRACCFDIIGDLALPAGVAPAWFRLEDGCL